MNHGFLKQSTASQTRLIGPFIDDTDGKTPETGLTIANTDINLSKNGAASAAKNSGGGTHITTGMYAVTFDATDTNTVGELAGAVNMSGAIPVVFKFTVIEEVIYDALFAASAAAFDANQRIDVGSWLGQAVTLSTGNKPDVNVDEISDDATAASNLELALENGSAGYVAADVKQLGSVAQSATDLKDLADTGYDPVAHKIQGVVLVDTTTTNTDMRGTDNAATASELAKVPKSDGTATWNATALASINAEVDTALSDYDPPTKAELDSGLAGLNDLTEAQVNAQVDLALNTAIPATPTADSLNDYIQRMKYVMVNKMEITEANGNTTIYKDDNVSVYASVAGAYSSDSTTTTRLLLE